MDDWLARPDVGRGVAAVAQAGLTYDILVFAHQLPAAVALVRAQPGTRFVLDHIAKPRIAAGALEPWATHMQALAALPNVWVKLSGMIEEADWRTWRVDDLVPYVRRVLDWVRPERLVFGSNWPVCLVAAGYARVHDALSDALGDLGADERARIFGGNAIDVYRLAVEA